MVTNDLKKGTKVKVIGLGVPCTGVIMDNAKGNIRMVDVHGSEVGMFDEMGSVYAHEIVEAEVNGEWVKVEHTPAQLKLKAQVNQIF
jgi:hypothetical protein